MDVLAIELEVWSVLDWDHMITRGRATDPTQPTDAVLLHDDKLHQLRPASATFAISTWH